MKLDPIKRTHRRVRRDVPTRRHGRYSIAAVDHFNTEQDRRCAICKKDSEQTGPLSLTYKDLGPIGLLCAGCRALRRRDPAVLRAAADWIDSH